MIEIHFVKAFSFIANMNQPEYTLIGRLNSTHGLEGNITLTHQLKGKNTVKKLQHIFVEVRKESYIPYFIENCTIFNEQDAAVLLDDVYSLEEAKKLAGKNVYIETELYQKLQPADVSMNFVGFTLYDGNDQKVGKITDIIEAPNQLLAAVELSNGNEALVPVVEHFISSINIAKRELTLQIPDGLIDLYLNP